MLSSYLPSTITNNIYPYLSWDTLIYHNVPANVWRTYSERLGFYQKDNNDKTPKEQFLYDLFNGVSSGDYKNLLFYIRYLVIYTFLFNYDLSLPIYGTINRFSCSV